MVWKVGVKVRGDEKGIVGREEVARCVGELMEGEEREKAMAKAFRCIELVLEAMVNGPHARAWMKLWLLFRDKGFVF